MASAAITLAPTPEKITLGNLAALNKRQREILALLAQGKTIPEIVEAMGVTRQRVYQVIDATRNKLPALMDECGITDAALVSQFLKPALSAMETEFAKFQGTITDSRDVVAWGPRLQALDIAAKMRGMYAKQADITVENKIAIVVENIGAE